MRVRGSAELCLVWSLIMCSLYGGIHRGITADASPAAGNTSCESICALMRSSEPAEVLMPVLCYTLSPKPPPAVPCGAYNEFFDLYRRPEDRLIDFLSRSTEIRYRGPVIVLLTDYAALKNETYEAVFRAKALVLGHTLRTGDSTRFVYQPDFYYLQHRGYHAIIKAMSGGVPIEARARKVFWRGTSTGVSTNLSCEGVPRITACAMAATIPWLDFQITTSFYQECKHLAANTRPNHVKEEYWARFRGVLDIDGNVNAWGLFWKLGSGSVVFKVNSPYTNSYNRLLRPWVHYIPIAEDLHDLAEVTSIVTNDSAVNVLREIASNAQAFVREHSYDREIKQLIHDVNHYFEAP